MTLQRTRTFAWIPLWLTAVAFAAANGLGYGGGNLQQYLLHGLHAADPGFLARDWFTVDTRPHHVLFTAFLGVAARFIPPHVTLGLLNLLCASIFAGCVHAIARRFHRMPLLVTSMTLVIILGSPRSPIALVSILTSYFQPSTVGAVGLLGGMILLSRKQWMAAAITLLAAGVFHIGYAIWVELLIAAILVRHRRMLGIRRATMLIAVAVIVASTHLPFFHAANGPDQLAWTAQAGKILHDVYMPYHSRPRTWPAEQWIRAASVLAAGIVAFAATRRLRRFNAVERTLAAFVACISLLGIVLTLGFEWDVMAMLLPYRICLLAILAAQIAAAAALTSDRRVNASWLLTIAIQTLIFVLLRRSGLSEYAGVTLAFAAGALTVDRLARDKTLPHLRAVAMALALCILVGLAGAGRNTLTAFAFFATAALLFHRASFPLATHLRQSRFHSARIGLAAIMAIQLAWMGRAAATRKDVLCEPSPKQQAELFDWCRNHTPADAVFVIPPDLSGFRLHARRATVIDYKCMPILPADTVSWGARLADVCGRPIHSISDALTGYRTMDSSRATNLKARYGAGYVVLTKTQATSLNWDSQPVFENRTFAVHTIETTHPPVAKAAQSVRSNAVAFVPN